MQLEPVWNSSLSLLWSRAVSGLSQSRAVRQRTDRSMYLRGTTVTGTDGMPCLASIPFRSYPILTESHLTAPWLFFFF